MILQHGIEQDSNELFRWNTFPIRGNHFLGDFHDAVHHDFIINHVLVHNVKGFFQFFFRQNNHAPYGDYTNNKRGQSSIGQAATCQREGIMENVHEKAERLKKLLADKYGIRTDEELARELAASRIDIGIFVERTEGKKTA